jgi:glucose-6-phosphate isomerase
MLTKNINFKNFQYKKNTNKIRNDLKVFLKENTETYKSLSSSYKNYYDKKVIKKLKKYSKIRIIGMGGSILGTESIYDFLKHKIKKKILFY